MSQTLAEQSEKNNVQTTKNTLIYTLVSAIINQRKFCYFMRHQAWQPKPSAASIIHRVRVAIRRLGLTRSTIRYVGIKTLLTTIYVTRLATIIAARALTPVVKTAGNIANTVALSSVLHLYFLFLKIRRRSTDASRASARSTLAVINRHLYHAAISLVVVIALLSNLTIRGISAETVTMDIPFSSILPSSESANATLIDEGPLTYEIMREQNGNHELFTDDITPAPYAPDTDDDDTFATAEDETAIIAPVVSTGEHGLTPQRDSIMSYAVEEGDTISTIAQKFDITINTILWHNNLSFGSTIRPGQSLAILPTSGVAHTVKSGDTVGAIAKKYQADAEEVIAQNKLADAGDIGVGDVLIVPDGIQPTAVAYAPRTPRNIAETIRDIFVPEAPTDTGTRLLWPLQSAQITQYFHYRHNAIDVGDKKGNPIYAAEAGKVERAGWTSGYGYNIIINHGNGLKTLYGHASKLLVSAGDTVARGDSIALIGSTGWSTGPHLHFEVISNGRKINPLNYLK